MKFHLVVQAADENFAGKLTLGIPSFLTSLATKVINKDSKTKDLPKFEAEIPQPTRTGARLELVLDTATSTAFLKPFEVQSQFRSDRILVARSFRDIARALHGYHDQNKSLPAPANYDKEGKPLLSWRVHVLPFLDQSELYKQFKLNEPWDSEHNKELIAKIPPAYRHPLGKGMAEGKTPFLVPVGPDTMFPGEKGLNFKEVANADGMSLTVMLLEVADDSMVVWTKPEDWQFDPKNPHRGLVEKSRPSFTVALGDSSLHGLKYEIPAEALKAAMTRNGREVHGPLDKWAPSK